VIRGEARQAREQPAVPPSLPALLAERGTGAHRDEVAVRLVDKTTETIDRASYGELYRRSLWLGVRLGELGVGRGDGVMLLSESRLEFYYALFGALLVGALPVAVYPPLGTRALEGTLRHLDWVVKDLGVRAIATSRQLFGVARRVAGPSTALFPLEGGGEEADGALPIEADAGERPVLLQYTSGSIGRPRAIELATPAIFANLRAIGDAFDMGDGDVGVSWLPLYHDMGLHSIFFDLIYRMQLVLMSPLDFLQRPSCWLRAVSRYRATHSPAPTFGFSFAARRVRDRDLEGVDLSSWRVAMCGAEPIDAAVLGAFAERFARCGFDQRAFMAAYGLAENTVAVSFAPPSSGLRVERLDAEALAGGSALAVANGGVSVVSCGRPIAGQELRVAGDGKDLGEGRVGEVQVRGPSHMRGYRGAADATARSFADGWLRTGDLGYVREGEVFVTGREKDLIIRGGRNFYPQDIEAAAAVDGVRRGSIVAFGVRAEDQGTENVVVVAEVSRDDRVGDADLAARVRHAVRDATGLQLHDVALVAKGVVPKTTSGKLRRLECRAMFLEKRLVPTPAPSALLLAAVGLFSLLPAPLQRWWSRARQRLGPRPRR
jgi:acyl-CoA synthetase (AMP-forming)/AMP-acid ligase II